MFSTKTLLALVPFFLQVQAQASGTGTTTRYWDCCKPSCAWPGKASLLSGSNPVTTCDISDNPLTDYNAASGCTGGTSYQCSNESPWAVTSELAYGFAAVNIAGGSESSWCCGCYELTFTSGAVAGKKMVVQATNTGGDLGSNQFDISIPGGGVGIYNGCTEEWGAPSSGWGAQYGGISDRSACATFPTALQDGCYWRYDWFSGADNPTVSFKQVTCPAEITAKSGCTRADDSSMGAAPSGSTSVAASSASSSAPASSASQVVSSSSSSSAAAAADTTTSTPAAVSTPVASSSTEEAAATSSPAEVAAAYTAPVNLAATTSTTSAVASITAAADDDECEL
ncbi:hypothetical protein BP5796_06465 [Coleophoma crateriformis]|uniref:Cellulase n=1 Tax=Coleophoma crateriformis TaxID=565419 RepID=A0A3D8RP24_9HELO|nr:hypothetical protein BP5796_06465 [Coleophoma crateriformis]